MSKAKRSRLMSRIRGRDTRPELELARLLRQAGLRPRRNVRGLPGTPDFAWTRYKVAVFVDGDFWHGWRFPRWEHKLQPFWRAKIARNRERDRSNFRKLRYRGWQVTRVWEHQLRIDPDGCVERILRLVADAREVP